MAWLGKAGLGRAGLAGPGAAGRGVARQAFFQLHSREDQAMATAATNGKATKASTNKTPAAKVLKLKPIQRKYVTCRIVGMGGPMVQHQWSEKAKQMMRDKQQQGKKTRERDLRDPAAEAEEAAYKTADGKYGLPMVALKAAIIGSAHKDLGIEKTLIRKALFFLGGRNEVAPFENGLKYEIGEDMVRVGAGSADLRYRPYFDGWSAKVTFEIDESLLQVEDFVRLLEWAGSRVGIGEMRPEKGGDCGRFRVDLDYIKESATPPKA